MNGHGRKALVIGGTGAVGSAVVRELSRAAIPVHFTYHQNEEKAKALQAETSAVGRHLDLLKQNAIQSLAQALRNEDASPDIVVFCAGVVRPARIDEASDEDWEATMAIHGRAAFHVCRDFGKQMAERGRGEIVLISALDRTQSLPIPATFAASQGLVSALVMAAGKDLGVRGVRVNAVALGLLDAGIGKQLDPKLIADYKSLSALRRLGTAEEAARTIAWVALQNTYLNGKVVSANGGI